MPRSPRRCGSSSLRRELKERESVLAARRLFFALWPERSWSERLIAAMPAAAGDSADAATGRVVAVVDLHVTLCFLGAVEESRLEPLCQRVSEVQAAQFELEFDAFEYWRRARALVATASRAPAAAVALVATLCAAARALGLSADERVLRPHVTLVRGLAATRTAGEPAAPHPEAPPPRTLPLKPPLPLLARRFHLAQSHELEAASATAPQGGRYSQLASWPLTAPAR